MSKIPTGKNREHSDSSTADFIQNYLSGKLTQEESENLWKRLENSPKLERLLFRQMELDVMLEEIAGEKIPMRQSDVSSMNLKKDDFVTLQKDHSFFRSFSNIVSISLFLIVLVTAIGLVSVSLYLTIFATKNKEVIETFVSSSDDRHLPAEPDEKKPEEISEQMSAAVAIISGLVDVVWDNRSGVFRQGQAVEPGWLRFREGLVSITFFNGAEVVVQGPAELKIISVNHVQCRFGNINVTVPPQAQGFLVSSPQMMVKDLGTEFSISVSPNGTEVHVIKGEVELHKTPHGQDLPASLKEGEAVFVASQGDLRRFQANNETFAPTRSLKDKTKEYLYWQYEKWQRRRQRFDNDPFLLFRFDFENLPGDAESVANAVFNIPKLVSKNITQDITQNNSQNTTQNIVQKILEGRIVGCRLTEGRWPGKGAIEFSRTSDRIRVYVPESCESITLSAWVRVNSLNRRSNILFVTESEVIDGRQQPALQWSILPSGSLRLELSSPIPGEQLRYESSPYFKPEHLGQWTHLAVVVDGLMQTVSHFVDGILIDIPIVEFPFKESLPIPIGMAEIGNAPTTKQPSKGTPIRNFCGCIDEFHFFSRALSREEIWDLYDPVTDWANETE
ncbi:MAG: FecR domain-containing protein [Planctomycetaceae bacterium]|jgi:hypothetical protein|nr:FecR domain-containing protein [Planctomycetaceae bacterium]